MQQYFKHFSTAKGQIGQFRKLVRDERTASSGAAKIILQAEIEAVINSLKDGLPFLRSVGFACETEVMITFYTTLLRRIDSS